MSDEEDEEFELAAVISNMRSQLSDLEDRQQDIEEVLERVARGKRPTVSTSLDEDEDDDDLNSTPDRGTSVAGTAIHHLASSCASGGDKVPSMSTTRGSVDHGSSDVKKKKNRSEDKPAIVPDDTDDLTDHEHEEDLSLYENKSGLAEDMKFLASMPELCDVTFLVGETREPVCAVRAILASRSRVFHKLLYHGSHQGLSAPATSANAASSGSSRESSHDEESKSKSGRRKSRRLKDAAKDTKLKLFLKRSSEPSLDGLPFGQNQASTHQTMIIEEFEPDVFRQLIEYIHTGCVTLQARTLLGLMNAADYYGLDELRRGCTSFVSCCINVDTVCALLASAERYIQYKCTKSLVQRVLEFVDQHGNEVLSLGSFALLPEHVVRLILSREELKADELSKFNAALHWSQRYCDQSPGSCDLREVISNFYECIEFYKIPAAVLMRDLHPLGVVPYDVLMNALAFQADPNSVDRHKVESPSRFRRMTLPHSNVAAADLHRLRQSAGSQFKSERSASTSTSGYAGSSDSNHIMSLSATTATVSGVSGVSGRSTSSTVKGSVSDDASDDRRRSSSAAAGESTASASKSPKKESEKDKLARYLANSKRRASRPFRRAKTLLDSTFHAH